MRRRHPLGDPTGKTELINGLDAYIATPEQGHPKHKLLDDDFAASKTVIPGYLNSDPISAVDLSDVARWAVHRGPDKTRPSLDKVIAGLDGQGATTFPSVGYCFGGAGPNNINRYGKTNVPLLIENRAVAQMFLLKLQVRTNGILADGKLMSEYKQDCWSCCRHEVAMCGYQNDLTVRTGKESVTNKK
ncbi:uncharacterized protein SCHCODRAFT_015595 [Schizophyllum commune H4-8]|uniref:uncharacterized protein n=1 Tax=Schizophyllum commune (strain H4-8 / FGSC 9210) TaxID=578458 RepID=UPI00215DF519|nr:uncharacterized protein SCHCODRAFT_015595 [Schizophyllum commune H4-8]KAI5895835.1 hypothetical protein SCHCODRAFT_015595 [Schizophyllum commune H4-8]